VRHPFGGGSTSLKTPAHPDISSFEDAERAAYQASTMAPPAGVPAGLAPAPEPPADRSPLEVGPIARSGARTDRLPAGTGRPDPAVRPAASAAAPQPEVVGATVAHDEDVGAGKPSSTEPNPKSTAADVPGAHTRRQPGETAPESLLRAPAAAASVVDDFFDGLVRRVEGDR